MRLVSITPHDAEGNRTQRYKLDVNGDKIDVTDYEWDNRNRLIRVTRSRRADPGGRVRL